MLRKTDFKNWIKKIEKIFQHLLAELSCNHDKNFNCFKINKAIAKTGGC